MSKWFITTDKLPEGKKLAGPFSTDWEAFDVRREMENKQFLYGRLWVQEEDTRRIMAQTKLKQAEGTPAKGEGENTSEV